MSVLDHYKAPRNRGELPSPPAVRVEGSRPVCGDDVVVFIQIDDGPPDAVPCATLPWSTLAQCLDESAL